MCAQVGHHKNVAEVKNRGFHLKIGESQLIPSSASGTVRKKIKFNRIDDLMLRVNTITMRKPSASLLEKELPPERSIELLGALKARF